MQVTPKSEEQIEKESVFAVWPEGIYNFEVVSASETVSKGGNEMIVLSMNIFNSQGESKAIKDYLLDAMAYKIRHACEACDLLSHYENGSIIAFDFEGKRGDLKLSIEKGKLKDDGSGDKHPDKNSVKDYVKPTGAKAVTARASAPVVATDLDDEIPF